MEVILEAMSHEARLIVIPASRLHTDFFQLRTRLAGEILQKFVNYRRRVAIIGDFSEFVSSNTSLPAFIDESNRGNTIWFLADIGQLDRRLALEKSNML
jgi:hypothetical protein